MKTIQLLSSLMAVTAIFGYANAQSPEFIARKFCEAVYNNDMASAKSYMTWEDAQRTPDKMRFSEDNDPDVCREKLRRAQAKIIENEWSSSIITVRFYDPDIEYLSSENRWFCCAIGLVQIKPGVWKVTDYGY